MLLRKICNRQQVFARHDRTRRIVRITNEQDLRPWCHVLLELGGRDAEFILLLGGHGDGNAASENRAGLIGDITWLRNEHLIPRREKRAHREVERLTDTDCHEDVRRRIVMRFINIGIVASNLLAQLR